MQWSYWFTIVLLLAGWAISDPQTALEFIAALQRQFRRSVAQRCGTQAVEELAQALKAEAKRMKIPQDIAEDVIAEHKEEIIERLGVQRMHDLLDN